jgi:hypothetical protein
MLALLAAATVAASPPPTERTPNLYRVPAGCRSATHNVVDRYGRPLPIRLGDLPLATPQLLVDRRVGGCPVITVMGRTPALPRAPGR